MEFSTICSCLHPLLTSIPALSNNLFYFSKPGIFGIYKSFRRPCLPIKFHLMIIFYILWKTRIFYSVKLR